VYVVCFLTLTQRRPAVSIKSLTEEDVDIGKTGLLNAMTCNLTTSASEGDGEHRRTVVGQGPSSKEHAQVSFSDLYDWVDI
jgi:hypothetical protein